MIIAIIVACIVIAFGSVAVQSKYAREDSAFDFLLGLVAHVFGFVGVVLLVGWLIWQALSSMTTPERDLKRVNDALASPQPVIFLAMPREALDPLPDAEIAGHFAPGMGKLMDSPRGKNLNIVIVPLETMIEALETPILKDWCIVLFVKNRSEGLLYPAYSCGVSEETWALGAGWVLGEWDADHLPKSFIRTPVVVRTLK
jgi:hypothetical protein